MLSGIAIKRLSCSRTRRARRHGASSPESFPVSSRLPESYTPAPAMACGAVIYQLDAGFFQSTDQLHKRVDVTADCVLARLHSLDRRKRQPGKLGELALVDVEQRTCCSHLRGRDHVCSLDYVRREVFYGYSICIHNAGTMINFQA